MLLTGKSQCAAESQKPLLSRFDNVLVRPQFLISASSSGFAVVAAVEFLKTIVTR